jgi:hypothetical protein
MNRSFEFGAGPERGQQSHSNRRGCLTAEWICGPEVATRCGENRPDQVQRIAQFPSARSASAQPDPGLDQAVSEASGLLMVAPRVRLRHTVPDRSGDISRETTANHDPLISSPARQQIPTQRSLVRSPSSSHRNSPPGTIRLMASVPPCSSPSGAASLPSRDWQPARLNVSMTYEVRKSRWLLPGGFGCTAAVLGCP